jgi:hypothetical protein
MPADVSFHNVSTHSVSVETAAPSRLPLGIGLIVAAAASIGLWFGVAAAIKALLF